MVINHTGVIQPGKMGTMMYDEYCFERYHVSQEADFLATDICPEEIDFHMCEGKDCSEEAVMEINGIYLCAECGRKALEEFNDDDIVRINGIERQVGEIQSN